MMLQPPEPVGLSRFTAAASENEGLISEACGSHTDMKQEKDNTEMQSALIATF